MNNLSSGAPAENSKWDAFLSYAGEDALFAAEIAGALKSLGFRIWHDADELRVGENLLMAIDEGLRCSSYGVLLISERYLQKGWPQHEMDVLIRQHIEKDRLLLPLWHGVSKEDVEKRHLGLAGIVAIRTELGLRDVTKRLAEEMSRSVGTPTTIPRYEREAWRFIRGLGELTLLEDDRAFTLWEALLHFPAEMYPLLISGEAFGKQDLLVRAAENIATNEMHLVSIFGEDTIKSVRELCISAGEDPIKYS